MSSKEGTIHVPRRENPHDGSHQTRAQEPVHPPAHGEQWDAPWQSPTNLAAPEPRAGMSQRWIRVSIHGNDDPTNVAKAFKEGWVPRKADTVPDGEHAPRISEGRWAGCIGVHGMILCEMPTQRVKQREAYFQRQANKLAQAVSHDLEKQSHPGMPIEQKRVSRVAVGRRPPVAAPEQADTDDS